MAPVETAAIQAWARYDSTVRTGGTREQRAWAYAHASKALDDLMAHENTERQRKATHQTEELETA